MKEELNADQSLSDFNYRIRIIWAFHLFDDVEDNEQHICQEKLNSLILLTTS